MNEEAERIAKLIEINQVDNYITKLNATEEELGKCALELSKRCPTKVLMLLAITPIEATDKNPSMFIQVVIPDRASKLLEQWLCLSIASVSAGCLSEVVRDVAETAPQTTRKSAAMTYPAQSEQSPIKLVEVVIGNAFAFLKKAGLYVEPEEEHEYDFDDIE